MSGILGLDGLIPWCCPLLCLPLLGWDAGLISAPYLYLPFCGGDRWDALPCLPCYILPLPLPACLPGKISGLVGMPTTTIHLPVCHYHSPSLLLCSATTWSGFSPGWGRNRFCLPVCLPAYLPPLYHHPSLLCLHSVSCLQTCLPACYHTCACLPPTTYLPCHAFLLLFSCLYLPPPCSLAGVCLFYLLLPAGCL